MKCIHCQYDSDYRQRKVARRCPGCRHLYAFEPREGDPVSDLRVFQAIERVSSRGRVRFGVDHLYYEVRRRSRFPEGQPVRAPSVWLLPFLVLAAALVFIAFGGNVPWLLAAGVILAIIALIIHTQEGVQMSGRLELSLDTFGALWRRYVAVHGAPASFIPPAQRGHVPVPFPEELLAYSFDRAVICDRPETVDLLLANQFHFENNCAVLGVQGYPPAAFEPVRTMLRNNPRLLVLALHDATPEGCALAHRLRHDAAWFRELATVIDVGLRPAHARFFFGETEAPSFYEKPQPSAAISESEAEWLSRNRLALAVLRPEQIIKRLFRAISWAERKYGESGSDSGTSFDSDWGSDWPQRDVRSHGGGGDSCDESELSADDCSADVRVFGLEADTSDGGGDSFG